MVVTATTIVIEGEWGVRMIGVVVGMEVGA